MKKRFFVFLLVAALFMLQNLQATTVTIYSSSSSPDEDTRIGTTIPAPDHDCQDLYAYAVEDSVFTARSLVKFNLSQIPQNAIVSSVKLYLYGTNSLTTYGDGLLQRITSTWDEHVTWGTRPNITSTNQIIVNGNQYPPYYNLVIQNSNLSSIVNGWISNPSTNYGFMFRIYNEPPASDYVEMRFGSSDNSNPSKRPKLEVTYTVPWTCGDVLLDSRDGKQYQTVQIGSYCWMKENLRYNYPGHSFSYNNDGRYDAYNGKYYDNPPAISSNVCPSGWRLPTSSELVSVGNQNMKTGGDFVGVGQTYPGMYCGAWDGNGLYSEYMTGTLVGEDLFVTHGTSENGGMTTYYYPLNFRVSLRCIKNTSKSTQAIQNTGDLQITTLPNPSTGIINIQLSQAVETGVDIAVFNLQGQKVFVENVANNTQNITLDLGQLPKGIYILKTMAQGVEKTEKLVLR